MHEAAIAASILEIAGRQANGDHQIRKVKIRLGEFTGAVRESVEFAFDIIKKGTPAENAVLDIEMSPLIACCFDCDWSGTPVEEFSFSCPHCGMPVQVLSGQEMDVEYIEVFVPEPALASCES
jgi:hydrogenase nickel incorporation protein HypA/HybF